MRRRAGARVAIVALAALVTAAPAAAQRVAIGVGAAVASPLLVDGNGTTVRLGAAPFLALDAARPLPGEGRLQLVGTARAAYAPVRASAPDARWRAGGVVQSDLTLGVLRPLRRGVRGRVALGATLLAGPRDVHPVRGTTVSPLAEAGVDATLRRAVRADVRVQGHRIAPERGAAGAVVRLLVGLTYAR